MSPFMFVLATVVWYAIILLEGYIVVWNLFSILWHRFLDTYRFLFAKKIWVCILWKGGTLVASLSL